MCVNGWESEYPLSVNSYESEYPKNDESGNIYESGKISSSVNLVLEYFNRSVDIFCSFLCRDFKKYVYRRIYVQYGRQMSKAI